MKKLVFAVVAIGIGFAVPLVAAEIVLRFLPVSTGLMSIPVNNANPVFRFQPDRHYLWSRDWNFSLVNGGRVNTSGFVNDQDYVADDPSPLLAVIGDSYVEATMVPYPSTLQGRLAAVAEGQGRVYSFAASGAPLSQYLAWARFAQRFYQADAMVFVVVGNDFHESLLSYKQGPGFHHYAEGKDGDLALVRVDYEPNPLRELVRRSALARYLVFNLKVRERLPRRIDEMVTDRERRLPAANEDGEAGEEQRYLGNVARTTTPERLAASKRAVDAFFRDMPEYSKLPPRRIMFVLDGVRYPSRNDPDGYFVQMRRYFIEVANAQGYTTIDMDDHFIPEHQANGTRFEYATDGHWNEIAHGMAATAVARTPLFAKTFGVGGRRE